MGAFTKGDVVIFPFPYTDLSHRKLRPCLVLSREMGEDIVLCQITSQQTRKDEYAIELGSQETTGGSLMLNSYIRANMIFTADKKQIQRKFCKISREKYRAVVEMIYRIVK